MKVPEELLEALKLTDVSEFARASTETSEAELLQRLQEIGGLLELGIDKISEHTAQDRSRPCGSHYDVNLEKLGMWATGIIKKNINDPCIDNIRFALYGDLDDMESYFIKRANGCCGFYDALHRAPLLLGGKKYLVGCNYGH